MLSWVLVLVSVCLSHVFEKVQRQNSPQLICDLGSISLALLGLLISRQELHLLG